MHIVFCLLFLVLAAATPSPATGAQSFVGSTFCGANPPEPAAARLLQNARLSPSLRTPEVLEVDVHVTTVSQDAAGQIPKPIIDNQIKIINDAFAPHNITFNLVKYTSTISPEFSQPKGNDIYGKIVPSLHTGGWKTLNLIFLPNVQRNNQWLGVCSYPKFAGQTDVNQDACVIDADTLPGRYKPGTDQQNRGVHPAKMFGKSAVHEIGHWFGLLHVFFPQRDTCDDPYGDYVDDTPMQRGPSWGCPAVGSRDSCPDKPGLDAVHNYMDYVADEW